MSRLLSSSVLQIPPQCNHPFTPDVFIHHQLTVKKLFDYPPGEIIEYPEAAISANGTVAHRFSLNQDNSHPKFNMQYSVGDKHGAVDYVFCGELLLDLNGKLVPCQKLTMSCRGLKQCEYDLKGSVNLYSPSAPDVLTPADIVFEKTLSFFCAVEESGCSFDASDLQFDYGGDSDTSDDDSGDNSSTFHGSWK
ncbi:hypothetical protein BDQ17DRAFT_1430695 [Cyathus striatus]|nr:hypothetical protein BDQ17DRAFT_1430694 [Cyathus striatus]KAF8994960.1 hypothetical protein BDQ17DRAFT_1430695 [Cyathus striatus]